MESTDMTETLFQLIEGSAALASFFVCLLWLWQVWLFKQDRERERAERAELRQEKKTLERAAAGATTSALESRLQEHVEADRTGELPGALNRVEEKMQGLTNKADGVCNETCGHAAAMEGGPRPALFNQGTNAASLLQSKGKMVEARGVEPLS